MITHYDEIFHMSREILHLSMSDFHPTSKPSPDHSTCQLHQTHFHVRFQRER